MKDDDLNDFEERQVRVLLWIALVMVVLALVMWVTDWQPPEMFLAEDFVD